jgi:hypothetical protein
LSINNFNLLILLLPSSRNAAVSILKNRRDDAGRPEYREPQPFFLPEGNLIANGDYDTIDTAMGGMKPPPLLALPQSKSVTKNGK